MKVRDGGFEGAYGTVYRTAEQAYQSTQGYTPMKTYTSTWTTPTYQSWNQTATNQKHYFPQPPVSHALYFDSSNAFSVRPPLKLKQNIVFLLLLVLGSILTFVGIMVQSAHMNNFWFLSISIVGVLLVIITCIVCGCQSKEQPTPLSNEKPLQNSKNLLLHSDA